MENDMIKVREPYRFFTDRSELERCLGGIQSTVNELHFSTKMSPPLGVFCKHQPSGGSPLASGSFPVAEKWKECRCPVRWDWPWNAFRRSSPQKGRPSERYSRQKGILFMCG